MSCVLLHPTKLLQKAVSCASIVLAKLHAHYHVIVKWLPQGQPRESRQSSEDRKTVAAAVAAGTASASASAGSGAGTTATASRTAARDARVANGGRSNSGDERCKTAKGSVSSSQCHILQQHVLMTCCNYCMRQITSYKHLVCVLAAPP
jgi:hypothetical protein